MGKDILVVTATLGDRDTLERTIESVVKIGGTRVKHIIITPQKKRLLLEKKYPFLEIIEEPLSSKGIYGALNYALLKYAKEYRYLTFINDDDYWLPNFINLFKELDNNERIDVVYGRVNFVNELNEIIYEQSSSSRFKSFKKLLFQGIVLFTQQATVMRSSVFIKQKGFDESFKLVSDTLFWINTIESGACFKYINTICAAYTIQEGQLSSDSLLQSKEHSRIIGDNSNMFILLSYFEKVRFRLSNIRIYLNRFLMYKNLKSKVKS